MKFLVILGLVVAPFMGAHASGEIEFGFSKTEGNTDNETVVAGLTMVNLLGANIRNNIAITSRATKNNGARSEERYVFTDKLDYLINNVSYAFGRVNHVHESFNAFDEESSIGFGYGRQLIKTDKIDFKAEVGPAYRILNPVSGSVSKEWVAYLGETLTYKLSDTASILQSLAVESGSDNTVTDFGVAIKSALTESLSLKVYARGTHKSRVGSIAENLDTETGVSVAYSFD